MTQLKRKIGLLGGSFNPAHDGHLHISKLALEILGLDELWWLVSPQNPLKSEAGMAPLEQRVASAKTVAKGDARIRVTDIEQKLNTRFTVDTLAALQAEYPENAFVWIIGADNLRQMPRWKGWRDIFRRVPIAVFPRAPYSLRAQNGRAARRFFSARIPVAKASRLVDMLPPAWVFLRTPLHGQSATRIRRHIDVSSARH
ncbi:nicotinate-nucleotide adenylyltransferase [Magnetovibrio sp.]|uniref:nicotinate-nucleotide adenylyltransferase n=1 Tax=Magnetovibrio sp. TaxID=2024836 RepID=UPI002F93B8BC